MRTVFTLLCMRLTLPFLVKQMTALDNTVSIYRELKVIFSLCKISGSFSESFILLILH